MLGRPLRVRGTYFFFNRRTEHSSAGGIRVSSCRANSPAKQITLSSYKQIGFLVKQNTTKYLGTVQSEIIQYNTLQIT